MKSLLRSFTILKRNDGTNYCEGSTVNLLRLVRMHVDAPIFVLDSLHPSARVLLRASIKVKQAAVLARRRARTGTPGHLLHARSLVRCAASRDVHVTSCSPRIATTWFLEVQRSIPVHETWPSLGRDEKVKRRVKSQRDGLVWRVRTSGAFLRHRHASEAIEGRIRSFSRSWNRTGHVGNPRRRRGRRVVASQAHLVVVVFELAGAGGACVAPSTSPGVFGETKEENLRWNTRLKWRRWRET